MPNDTLSNNNASNVWDPSTISDIVFFIVMVFIGLIAIWQVYHAGLSSRRTIDEERSMAVEMLSCTSTLRSGGNGAEAPTSLGQVQAASPDA
ncbi:MAG: hypothetical protein M1839_003571 [Geoglossum umbratile]|nr:MAG: hypothetical protein M1839_003571 [Geoglossum umbratile]